LANDQPEHQVKLSSSHVTATTGDVVRFTLTIPSSVKGTIVGALIKVNERYNEASEKYMKKSTRNTYVFNYRISGNTSGKLRIMATLVIREDGVPDMFRSNVVEMMVIPKMDELWGIAVIPNERSIILRTGKEWQVDILGAFSDGYDRFISEAIMGTTYEIVGEPGIASVNSDGVIKGLKAGIVTLVVRNGNISTSSEVMILQALKALDSDIDEPDIEP
jgi:hypothetical protein